MTVSTGVLEVSWYMLLICNPEIQVVQVCFQVGRGVNWCRSWSLRSSGRVGFVILYRTSPPSQEAPLAHGSCVLRVFLTEWVCAQCSLLLDPARQSGCSTCQCQAPVVCDLCFSVHGSWTQRSIGILIEALELEILL